MTVVTTTELREHLNLPADQDEDLLAAKLAAAEKHLESFTGKAFLTQTRTVRLDGFRWRLELPVSPVQEIETVKYLDPDLTEQTLAAENYVATPLNTEDSTFLYPASGASWPLTSRVGSAVSVTVSAGYGDAADVPAPLVEAIKQLAAFWYENREAVFVGNSAQAVALPFSLLDLIEPYRRRVF